MLDCWNLLRGRWTGIWEDGNVENRLDGVSYAKQPDRTVPWTMHAAMGCLHIRRKDRSISMIGRHLTGATRAALYNTPATNFFPWSAECKTPTWSSATLSASSKRTATPTPPRRTELHPHALESDSLPAATDRRRQPSDFSILLLQRLRSPDRRSKASNRTQTLADASLLFQIIPACRCHGAALSLQHSSAGSGRLWFAGGGLSASHLSGNVPILFDPSTYDHTMPAIRSPTTCSDEIHRLSPN